MCVISSCMIRSKAEIPFMDLPLFANFFFKRTLNQYTYEGFEGNVEIAIFRISEQLV